MKNVLGVLVLLLALVAGIDFVGQNYFKPVPLPEGAIAFSTKQKKLLFERLEEVYNKDSFQVRNYYLDTIRDSVMYEFQTTHEQQMALELTHWTVAVGLKTDPHEASLMKQKSDLIFVGFIGSYIDKDLLIPIDRHGIMRSVDGTGDGKWHPFHDTLATDFADNIVQMRLFYRPASQVLYALLGDSSRLGGNTVVPIPFGALSALDMLKKKDGRWNVFP